MKLVTPTETHETIWELSVRMAHLANSSGELVLATFSGIELVARPGDSAKAVERFYWNNGRRDPETVARGFGTPYFDSDLFRIIQLCDQLTTDPSSEYTELTELARKVATAEIDDRWRPSEEAEEAAG